MLSMTPLLAAHSTSATDLAAAWTSGVATPDYLAVGISASLSGSGVSFGTQSGSNDGTYGTYGSGAPVLPGCFSLNNNGTLTLTIANNTGSDIPLQGLHLDFNRQWNNSPQDITVTYLSGDLGNGPVDLGGLYNLLQNSATLTDFFDLSIDLVRSGLSTHVLPAGGTATFALTASDASGTSKSLLDNLAVTARFTTETTPVIAGRPNVIIFYADDVGWGDPACYNSNSLALTPNIDALAAAGKRFTDVHTVHAVCAPGRYGILTGNYAFRGRSPDGIWNINDNSQILPGQKTLGDLFQAAGYRTAFVGKMHMGGRLQSLPEKPEYLTFINRTDTLCEWDNFDFSKPMPDGLRQHGFDYTFLCHAGFQPQPYFFFEHDRVVDPGTLHILKVANMSGVCYPTNFTVIEYDRDPDGDGYLSRFDNMSLGSSTWDSTKAGEDFVQTSLHFMEDHALNHPDSPFFLYYCSQCVHVPHTPATFYVDTMMSTQQVAGTSATAHLDMVYEMDLQLKALQDKLEQLGVLDNTLIIFTSDNGGLSYSESYGHDSTGIFRGYKGETWEGGHRVPFIVRWGDGTAQGSLIEPGSLCDQPVSQADMMATFAELLGTPLSPDQGLDSISVLPYFYGNESALLRDHLLSYREGYSFRRDGWKIRTGMVASWDATPDTNTLFELYHLDTDPAETMNLGNSADPEHIAIKEQLFSELSTMYDPTPETPSRSMPAQDSDRDGLFDKWELAVAGDLDTFDETLLTSSLDSDGDGLTDAEEYRTGTDPFDPDDTFNVAGFSRNGGANSSVLISWHGHVGKFYRISESGDLQTWTALPGFYVGKGTPLTVELSAEEPSRFYRVFAAN